MSLKLAHVLHARQFEREWLMQLMARSKEMDEMIRSVSRSADEQRHDLAQRFGCCGIGITFFEDSTRTLTSFQTAAQNLGVRVVFVHPNITRMSSMTTKRESGLDTVRVLMGNLQPYQNSAYVIRHPKEGFSLKVASTATVPIINGGDGTDQHPSQALLDFFTILQRFGSVDGLRIAMVGDLRFGRTIKSLSYLLGKVGGAKKIYFVAPPERQIPEGIEEYLDRHGMNHSRVNDLHKVARRCDVIYLTRIQRERPGSPPIDLNLVRQKFSMNRSVIELLKPDMIIMHPLPRDEHVRELPKYCDKLSQAWYFRQADFGVPVRMALLEQVLLGNVPKMPKN